MSQPWGGLFALLVVRQIPGKAKACPELFEGRQFPLYEMSLDTLLPRVLFSNSRASRYAWSF